VGSECGESMFSGLGRESEGSERLWALEPEKAAME
jgi:hypothetical protein